MQLDTVLILVFVDSLHRFLIVAGVAVVHEVVIKGTGLGLRLLFQTILHGTIVVIGNTAGKQENR